MALLLNWTVSPNLVKVCLLLSNKTYNHVYKGQQVEKKHTLFVQDVYKMPQNIGNDFVSSRHFSLCRHTRPLSPATSGNAWRGGAVVFTTWIWLHPEPGPSQGGSQNCTSSRVLIFWTWTIRWTWLMRIITGSQRGLLRSILQCGKIWEILKGILIYLLWPSFDHGWNGFSPSSHVAGRGYWS